MSEDIRPDYYKAGSIEAKEVIESMGYAEGFYYGNALKYLMRYGKKGSKTEDAIKARTYLGFLIELLEKNNNE